MKNSKLHTTEDKSNEKVTSSNSKSEDEQLMEVMLYVRTTHEVEHNDNQWTREFVFSFDEAKAKINRLIVQKQLQIKANVWQQFKDAMMKQDLSGRPPKGARFRTPLEELTVILEREIPLAELTKELGDSEAEKNSGTWSRL